MKAAAPILCLLLLGSGSRGIEIIGPPAIPKNGTARFSVKLPRLPKGAKLEWRFDAPGYLETDPKMDPNRRTVVGADAVRMTVGARTGEGRVTVSIIRNGRRIHKQAIRYKIVEPIEVTVRFRPVLHAKGGTRGAGLLRFRNNWPLLAGFSDAVLAQAGIRLKLEMGTPVKLDDSYFDDQGTFHPVSKSYGKRAKSHSLARLWRKAKPDAVDVFLVRNCFWKETVHKGFQGKWLEHTIKGVAMERESVTCDDEADAVTLVHELGHVLGLSDLDGEDEKERLMYSIGRHRKSLRVTYAEMETMRRNAAKLLKNRYRKR